jgi:hypothetical protein
VIELDARVVVLAAVAGVVTAAAPFAVGGGVLVAGLLAGFLAGRSVLRAEEADVTTAIVVGGLVALLALSHGHAAAFAVGAGVFVGSEIAALGRRLGVDHDAPAGPELAIASMTVAVGLAAGAAVALVASVRASPPIANFALVVAITAGIVALVASRWGE